MGDRLGEEGGSDDGVSVSLYSSFAYTYGTFTGHRPAAKIASLLLTSGPARCEAVLHSCGTSPVCLFYTIATVSQFYHGSSMTYEMRRKPNPTLLVLATQRIFNFRHHLGMV